MSDRSRGMDVLVAGGTGFIGRALCRVLDDRGHAVTAASRRPEDGDLPSTVDRVALDVTDNDPTSVVDGHDVVVNLVALPSHRRPRRRSHEDVHLGGTRNLVAASEATGVDRFVQMSGLGVESDIETAYLRAKRRAEDVVRDSSLDWVIYRPSVVFGDGCAFLPFLRSVTAPVLTPLPGGGEMRIHPIWVGDLAPMIADGVEADEHVGETYRIGGPEKLTLAAVVEMLRDTTVVPVPRGLAAVGFTVAEFVPGIPFDRDQHRVFGLDNTVDDNDVAAFGVEAADLRTLGAYLANRGGTS